MKEVDPPRVPNKRQQYRAGAYVVKRFPLSLDWDFAMRMIDTKYYRRVNQKRDDVPVTSKIEFE